MATNALGGAAGGADSLMDIIRQKLIEQSQIAQQRLEQQRLAQSDRQFNANLGLNRDQLGLQRDEFGFRKDRAGVDDQHYADEAPDRAAGVRLKTLQGDDIARRPQAEADARDSALSENDRNRTFEAGQNNLNRQNAKDIANTRSLTPHIQQIRTIDASGRPVTKLIDTATGQEIGEFPSGLTPEELIEKLRKEAEARARGAADGKAAGGGGGLFDIISRVFGGGDDAAPAAAPAMGGAAGGAAASGPKVGERRVINGIPAQWDGHGWLPIGK